MSTPYWCAPLDEFNVDVEVWVSGEKKSRNKIPFFKGKLMTNHKGEVDELIKYGVPEIMSDLGLKMTGELSAFMDPKRGLYMTTYAEKEAE